MFSSKPVFALSACVALFVLILVFHFDHQENDLAKDNQTQTLPSPKEEVADIEFVLSDQDEYLAYFFEQSDDDKGYGTSLESYFL